MDPSYFDITLASALGDPIAAAGDNGAVYTADTRRRASARAIQEYSRYRKIKRRYGTGYTFLSATGTQFLMVGGGFIPTDYITLDPYTAIEETVQVVGTAPVPISKAPPGNVTAANLTQVTLVAPGLQFPHPDSAFVSNVKPGLQLLPNQDTYQLPYDWITIDQSSFDIATGVKFAWKDCNAYYDASYIYAQQLTGLGMGYSSDYGVNNPYGYAIAGNPYNNPNGAPNAVSTTAPGFQFYSGNAPKMTVNPIPTSDILLSFDYYASHTISTVPTADEDAVVAYAQFAAMSSRALAMNENQDRKIGLVTYMGSHNVKNLNESAKAARLEFDLKIRLQPMITSG